MPFMPFMVNFAPFAPFRGQEFSPFRFPLCCSSPVSSSKFFFEYFAYFVVCLRSSAVRFPLAGHRDGA